MSHRHSSPGRDVIIVGAGIIGCCIALEMSRAGFKTVNIDTRKGAGQGPTSSSAGIVRTFASQRAAIQLARAALPIWHSWGDYLACSDSAILAEIRTCGSLLLDADDPYAKDVAAAADSVSLPYGRLSTDAIREWLPFLDMHSYGPPRLPDDPAFWDDPTGVLNGGLYFPDSGYVSDPLLATINVRDAAQRCGAEFVFGRTVTHVTQRADRVGGVRLDDGSLVEAPILINTTGVHSDAFNVAAGVVEDMSVRTRILRQELHHAACPPALDFERRGVHVVDADLGINLRPEVGDAVLVGSNGAAVDSLHYLEREAEFDPTLTRSLWETYTLRLARRIPEIGVPSRVQGVSGLYDVSDDWVPIYDKSVLPGYYMAIGTSGNQFKTSPIVGKVMTELIQACEAGAAHDDAPIQAPLADGSHIDLGVYSRRRPIENNGAQSVNG